MRLPPGSSQDFWLKIMNSFLIRPAPLGTDKRPAMTPYLNSLMDDSYKVG